MWQRLQKKHWLTDQMIGRAGLCRILQRRPLFTDSELIPSLLNSEVKHWFQPFLFYMLTNNLLLAEKLTRRPDLVRN
jgi:hypothetical protein